LEFGQKTGGAEVSPVSFLVCVFAKRFANDRYETAVAGCSASMEGNGTERGGKWREHGGWGAAIIVCLGAMAAFCGRNSQGSNKGSYELLPTAEVGPRIFAEGIIPTPDDEAG